MPGVGKRSLSHEQRSFTDDERYDEAVWRPLTGR
jgi:hypothetical protein